MQRVNVLPSLFKIPRHLFVICIGVCIGATGSQADEKPLSVYAAASLTTVLTELSPLFEKELGLSVAFVHAGSGTLARQIENGAPADLFLSADEKWISYLADAQRIDAETKRAFATNRLALIAPAESGWSIELDKPDLAGVLDGKPFALGDPASVPAGMYGEQALRSLGLYESLKSNLAFGASVRVVLAWVARGDAAAGLVYVTDTLNDTNVRVITLLPDDSHDPISYWAAGISDSPNIKGASAFLDFLESPEAQTVLVTSGFALPVSPPLDPLHQSP